MANIERLKHLQDVLRNVPEGALEMDKWSNPCGTSACAVGWSCMDKEFREQGLGFVSGTSFLTGDDFLQPAFKNEFGWDAVTEFFEIEHSIASLLFDQDSYFDDIRDVYADNGELKAIVTPVDVMKRVQIVIDNPNATCKTIHKLTQEMEQNV